MQNQPDSVATTARFERKLRVAAGKHLAYPIL